MDHTQTPYHYHRKSKLPKQLIGLGVFVVVMVGLASVLVLSQMNQETRRKAAAPNGSLIELSKPNNSQFAAGESHTVTLSVDASGITNKIDGFQIIADIKGTVPQNLAISAHPVIANNSIFQVSVMRINKDRTPARLEIVVNSSDLLNPIPAGQYDVANLTFTAPNSGALNLDFNSTTIAPFSKIAENKTAVDKIVTLPANLTYNFVVPQYTCSCTSGTGYSCTNNQTGSCNSGQVCDGSSVFPDKPCVAAPPVTCSCNSNGTFSCTDGSENVSCGANQYCTGTSTKPITPCVDISCDCNENGTYSCNNGVSNQACGTNQACNPNSTNQTNVCIAATCSCNTDGTFSCTDGSENISCGANQVCSGTSTKPNSPCVAEEAEDVTCSCTTNNGYSCTNGTSAFCAANQTCQGGSTLPNLPCQTTQATASPSPTTETCPVGLVGNFNPQVDCVVDMTDYSILTSQLLQPNPLPDTLDMNDDGVVDISDYSLFATALWDYLNGNNPITPPVNN